MKTLSQQAGPATGKTFGDKVLASQQMGEGFSHVSKLWLDKTLTFQQMIDKAREFQRRCRDVEGSSLSDFFSRLGSASVEGLGDVVLSDTAHRQLCSHLGLPHAYLSLLQRVDAGLYDSNLNSAVDRAVKARKDYDLAVASSADGKTTKPERPEHMDREVFLRLLESSDGSSRVLRAVLSSRYAVINNLPVIETMGDVVPGGRVSHLHYDGDTLRANILVPDLLREERDSDYGGGISVLNNETGRFMFRSRPFVFRAICMNGNIWDKTEGSEFNRRHLGTINWAEFRKALVMNIQRQVPLAAKHIEKVLSLKGVPVTQQQIEQSIVYLGRREKLTLEQVRSWMAGVEIERKASPSMREIHSAFGVVQGLTRAAQGFPFEAQELMETLSARLIDSNWDRILTSATAEVTPEEAKEALSPAA